MFDINIIFLKSVILAVLTGFFISFSANLTEKYFLRSFTTTFTARINGFFLAFLTKKQRKIRMDFTCF